MPKRWDVFGKKHKGLVLRFLSRQSEDGGIFLHLIEDLMNYDVFDFEVEGSLPFFDVSVRKIFRPIT